MDRFLNLIKILHKMVNFIKHVLKGIGTFFILVVPGLLTTFFTIKFVEKIYKHREL